MFPWPGASAPARALAAAAAASAPPPHGLRLTDRFELTAKVSFLLIPSSFFPIITFAVHYSGVDLICIALALIQPHKIDVLIVFDVKKKL